jgi:hypothetical protein
MGKSKWFCPKAEPRPLQLFKKTFQKILRYTAMELSPTTCLPPANSLKRSTKNNPFFDSDWQQYQQGL